MLVGDNSTRHITVEFANNIEQNGRRAHDILSNRNLFDTIGKKLYIKHVRSINSVMKGAEIKDKMVWKFNDVYELEDFMENAKLMAKRSPATLKFLMMKSPIFIVGGLAL